MLRPKKIGVPFKRLIHYGTKVFYGSGVKYGESKANAVIMHQRDSSEYPTSGISTTEIFKNAVRYATHNGKYAAGVVYKIDAQLFEEHEVKCYAVDEYAVKPAIPEDKEVILVAKDFGQLPKEIVVQVISV